jgi:hypothetical protein
MSKKSKWDIYFEFKLRRRTLAVTLKNNKNSSILASKWQSGKNTGNSLPGVSVIKTALPLNFRTKKQYPWGAFTA